MASYVFYIIDALWTQVDIIRICFAAVFVRHSLPFGSTAVPLGPIDKGIAAFLGVILFLFSCVEAVFTALLIMLGPEFIYTLYKTQGNVAAVIAGAI